MSFLIRARIDKQIQNNEIATTPNARLNLRRKAAGFILRMFQLHAEDRARLSPLSGSSGLNLNRLAKIALFFG